MKCFIFSNCLKSTPDDFLNNVKKLNIYTEDILIFLNKGKLIYPYKEYFAQFKHKHLFMRNCKRFGISSFFGFNTAFDNPETFETVNGITGDSPEIIIQRGKYQVSSSTIIKFTHPDIQKYFNNINGIKPTTGYLAYYIVMKLFSIKESDIILVNFYGNLDNSTYKWKNHNWSFEDTWLQSKNRVFC